MDKKVRRKGEALFLVVNIVLATVAFAFILGLSAEVVSAQSAAEIAAAQKKLAAENAGIATDPTFKTKWVTGDAGTTGQAFSRAFIWAAIAFMVAPMIADLLGLEEGEAKAFQYGLTAGLFTYKAIAGLAQSAIATQTTAAGGVAVAQGSGTGFASLSQGAISGIGLGVGIVIFVLLYKKEKIKYVEFQCLPWEAPIGGENCEKCNDGIHPCSEYRCSSLGQACEIVDPSNDLCVWVNKRDVNSALITPWEEVLTEPYVYTRTQSRPPSWGTEITPSGDSSGCIQAFSPLEFGIRTNKPTQCKVDFEIREDYDTMAYYFGESNLFSYNHSQGMNVPNAQAIVDLAEAEGEEIPEGLLIENANDYNLYVRCTTANGFYNVDPYVIRFCVDDGPDATPPQIVETSIRNNQPVQFEVDIVPIEVYTNELTNCRWSRLDESFNAMENEMSCSSSLEQLNSDLLYTCTSELTGLQDRQNNEYYFRCEDQPYKPKDERNVMTQSYVLNLIGTQPLNIKDGSVRPLNNSVVEGATSNIEVTLAVTTEDGFNNGEATCFYSLGEGNTNYIKFFETDSHLHTQRQDLAEGTYIYNYLCIDAGGNSDETSTTFEVFVDTQAPVIVRILRDSNNLQIITNENAVCRYTNDLTTQCNFNLEENDGSPMQYQDSSNQNIHLASWDTTKTYYIKCKDFNGKQPNPNSCSVVVRPEEI